MMVLFWSKVNHLALNKFLLAKTHPECKVCLSSEDRYPFESKMSNIKENGEMKIMRD